MRDRTWQQLKGFETDMYERNSMNINFVSKYWENYILDTALKYCENSPLRNCPIPKTYARQNCLNVMNQQIVTCFLQTYIYINHVKHLKLEKTTLIKHFSEQNIPHIHNDRAISFANEYSLCILMCWMQ